MQRVMTAVKLRQMTVSVFLHIDTCVNLIGDVNMTGDCLILAGMKGCQVLKVVCGKLSYTNFPWHVYQWGLGTL